MVNFWDINTCILGVWKFIVCCMIFTAILSYCSISCMHVRSLDFAVSLLTRIFFWIIYELREIVGMIERDERGREIVYISGKVFLLSMSGRAHQ